MKTLIAVLLTIVALASIESALGRWLPSAFSLPIILPLLLGASFLLPHHALLRLTLLGASAAELGSGLPPGIAFAATLLPPHALLALNRQPRPELPWAVRGGMSALVQFLVLAVLGVSTRTTGPLPPHLVPSFLLLRLVLPAAVAGGIAAITLPSLKLARTRSLFHLLGIPLT